MKKLSLLTILASAILLAGCGNAKTAENTPKKNPNSIKVLLNELPLVQRPFTVLVPHETNRLFTFVTQNADKAKEATLDLEYQSGDLLKAAKTSLTSPITNPYIKAIILGSCSTGGKCTFDKELATGTMKFKLIYPDNADVAHLLKGDFTFVTGSQNLPDGRVSFKPAKTNLKDNLILMNSIGLPKSVEGDIVLYPIIISSTSNKKIAGDLSITASDIVTSKIYNGTNYEDLKFKKTTDGISIALNNTPWSMPATIIRDDQKGATESITLYLLGPILLQK